MDKRNELRTAYTLATLGTLSATAKEIGVHRSTVMRHIDVLEDDLKVKLFQRNDKGYLPTEAGLEIMRLGEVTDNHFNQFANQVSSKESQLKGTLVITCVTELAKALIPSITQYQQQFPDMQIEVIGDIRKYGLEYGEADLAIRTGNKPTTLDNVVVPFGQVDLALCAHQLYIDRYGLPDKNNMKTHRFIAQKDRPEHLGWNEWIYNNIPEDKITFVASSPQILHYALLGACGLAFVPRDTIGSNNELVEIEIEDSWSVPLWILVHRDMIAVPKIRKFLDILKMNHPKLVLDE